MRRAWTKGDALLFKYPYIRYYFTARYLADSIGEQEVRRRIQKLSEERLRDRFNRSGNQGIFLSVQ